LKVIWSEAMKVKIRKGDTVEIMSGRFEEKGKRGEVINVMPEERLVVVQGVNIRTKHQKQVEIRAGRNMNPGRIKYEAPLAISNVMLVCPKCGEPTRISIQRDETGSHRVCKHCQALID
jgi:large subunit ribosomal protein L24